MYYALYFLTLLALFSALFFIAAVVSSAKMDRLFEERTLKQDEKSSLTNK